ncbi:hypothetical protein FHG87_022170 [Trinorchestia longiramus]|nr:hypothetical protein FHG87_022170 [Trinorchestia longiramus]
MNASAVLTMTSCDVSNSWQEALADTEVLHIALTPAGCERLQSPRALTLPVLWGTSGLVQVMTDILQANLLALGEVTLISDDSAGM